MPKRKPQGCGTCQNCVNPQFKKRCIRPLDATPTLPTDEPVLGKRKAEAAVKYEDEFQPQLRDKTGTIPKEASKQHKLAVEESTVSPSP